MASLTPAGLELGLSPGHPRGSRRGGAGAPRPARGAPAVLAQQGTITLPWGLGTRRAACCAPPHSAMSVGSGDPHVCGAREGEGRPVCVEREGEGTPVCVGREGEGTPVCMGREGEGRPVCGEGR